MRSPSRIIPHLIGLLALFPFLLDGLSLGNDASPSRSRSMSMSRRELFVSTTAVTSVSVASLLLSSPTPAWAVADCFQDCLKNCKIVAPKDPEYCIANCKDYCEQEDRTDGLSGSVSADSGEVGILGGTFGQGTVPKGEDRPPTIKIPGLDFTSDKGKKLLGY